MGLEIMKRHALQDLIVKTTGSGQRVLAGYLVAVVAVLLLAVTETPAQAQQCPPGQITCQQFCDLAKDDPRTCKYGPNRSCISRFGNVNHCVGRNANNLGREDSSGRRRNTETRPGQCAAGQITCSAWCDKYSGNPHDCKYTAAKSCMAMHGNVYWCTNDRPPAN